jgi:ankyrin repeat protein
LTDPVGHAELALRFAKFGWTNIISPAYRAIQYNKKSKQAREAAEMERIEAAEPPLIIAIRKEEFVMIEQLLSQPLDLELRDTQFKRTALAEAAFLGQEDIVRRLVAKGSNLDAIDNDRRTPLLLSLYNQHESIALLLLQSGASPSASDKYLNAPLHYAAITGCENVASLLLSVGANINVVNSKQETPLHCAAVVGTESVARVLTDDSWPQTAGISARDANGNTPLHCAISSGNDAIAQILHQCGADVNATNRLGQTPAFLAFFNNKSRVKVILEMGGEIWGRLPNGALFDISDALLQTTHSGHKEEDLAVTLLQHTRDLERTDEKGRTALHIASQRSCVSLVEQLLQRGADPNRADHSGRTSLHMAVHGSFGDDDKMQQSIVKLLIENGAEISRTNNEWKTALQVIPWWRNGDAVRQIVDEALASRSASQRRLQSPGHVE